MKKEWSKVRLGEVLKRSDETISPSVDAEYREITVRLWGKGVIERGLVSGASVSGRRFIARTGQFIVSRIDARNGAMGIVPETLDRAIVTNDFPLFNINIERLLPAYLGWLCRTQDFVELCRRASEGTTNRVRLKEDRFLEVLIPLPSLVGQNRIVTRVNEVAVQSEEARISRQQAFKETDALFDSFLSSVLIALQRRPDVDRGPLRLFAEVNPIRRGEIAVEQEDLVSFVPMKAVDDIAGKIITSEIRTYAEVMKGYTYFMDGDVIFARITPCMENGKTALARNLMNGVGFGSTEFHVLRPGPKLIPEWLYILVRHRAFRNDAAEHFKGTAGQQRVPESFLKKKIIVVPPIFEQRGILAELNVLQAEIDQIKRLQVEAAYELHALSSAILNRAFNEKTSFIN